MNSIEKHSEDWKEMRSRVDSIASAVFLVGGGSLSLSITIILGSKDNLVLNDSLINTISCSWYSLLASIILALFMKINLVLQSFLLQEYTDFMNTHYRKFNAIGWVIGTISFILFSLGISFMVISAVGLIGGG